jgi:hypothetical protein
MANDALKLCMFLFVISSLQIMAQKAAPEFSVHAGGGISTYCFQPKVKGISSLGFISDIGAGFTGFVSQQVGIHTGVAFGLFNVKSRTPDLKTITTGHETPMLIDGSVVMLPYDLHTTLKGYTDIHKTLFVNIPVMLQFQTKQKQYWSWKRSQKAGFYAIAGIKVLFLLDNKYETRLTSLYNEAYFPTHGGTQGTQLFAGLGTFDNDKKGFTTEGKLDFGVMAMAAIETGVKWRVDNNIFIYTGVFFDCGLNDPIKDGRALPDNFIWHDQLDELTLVKFANKANLMTVGIKVRVAFTKHQRPY